MVNPPPIRPILFPGPKRGYESALSGVISTPLPGRLKCAKIEACLSEIRVQKLGPSN